MTGKNYLWCAYETYPEVIEDTFGDDGPYTGFSEVDDHAEFRYVSLTPPKSWDREHVAIGFKPKAGGVVWVAYVIYADGDSFGRHGGQFLCLGIFNTQKAAKKCAEGARHGTLPLHPKHSTFNDFFGGPEHFEVVEAAVKP